ncbi:MAG: aminoacyl-tRNA hydrolase [Myxococcota bacterium]
MGEAKDGDGWVVAGLGNPGSEYEATRHNVGFMVADALAKKISAGAWRRKFGADLCEATVGGRRAWIVKPRTYMNLSGQAVSEVARYFGVAPSALVVIHDDVDLELGRLKVKLGGGHAGHKGVRSVMESLGTPEFARVRVGVGKRAGRDTADWVLDAFGKAERKVIEATLVWAADAVETIVQGDITAAMNRYNVRPTEADADEEQS